MVRVLFIAWLTLVLGCGRDRVDPKVEALLAKPQWSQADWLEAGAALEGVIKRAQLGDERGRALFDRFVTAGVWHGAQFQRDGDRMVAAFPVLKQVQVALVLAAAADELPRLLRCSIELSEVFLAAGEAFLAALPPEDPSRANRLGGLDRMRLGLAMTVIELLYAARAAGAGVRDAAIAFVEAPARLARLSDTGLQLVVATIDEHLSPADEALQRLRAALVAEQGRRPVSDGPKVTYQGIPPPPPLLTRSMPQRSPTGGFVVDAPPWLLVKRVDGARVDGAPDSAHWVEGRIGGVVMESMCSDAVTADELDARVSGLASARPLRADESGRWYTLDDGAHRGRMRITTIAGRGCVASIEGPAAELPAALLESFPRSLRAATD